MNKYFSKVTSLLLAGVMVFAAGCTDVERDVNDLDQAVSAVEGNIASLAEQLDGLKTADEALKASIAASKEEAAKLYATKDELTAAKGELNAAIKDLEAADKILEEKISTAVTNASTAINNLEKKHDSDIATLRESLTNGLSEVKDLISGQKTTIESLQNAINAHEKDYEGYKATTNAALESIRQTYDSKIADLQALIEKTENTLKGSINDNKAAIAANLAAINKNAAEIVAIRAEVSKGLTELEIKISGMIAAVEAKVQANAAAIEKINEIEIPKINDRITASEALIAALKAEDLNLYEAISALRIETAENLAALQSSVDALKATVAQNDAKVEAYYEELTEKFNGYVTLEAHETALAELEARLMAELEALEDKLNEKIETNSANIAANKELIEANTEQIAANAAKIGELFESADEINAHLAQLDKELGLFNIEVADSLAAHWEAIENAVFAISGVNDRVSEVFTYADDTHKKLMDAINEYRGAIGRIDAQLLEMTQTDDLLKKNIKKNADDITLLLTKIEANAEGILALQNHLAATLPEMDHAIGALKDADEKLNEAIKDIQNHLAATLPALDIKIGDINDAIEKINDAIEGIQNHLAATLPALDHEIGALKDADTELLEAIGDAKSSLEGRINTLKETLEAADAALQSAIDKAVADIEGNKANIETNSGNIAELYRLVAEVRNEAKQAVANANADITTLTDRVDGIKTRLKTLENTVETLTTQLDKLLGIETQVGNNTTNIATLFARVQSVVYVPTKVDGMIHIPSVTIGGELYQGTTTTVSYKVLPENCAQEIVDGYTDGSIDLKLVPKAVTKADAPLFDIASVTANGAYITLKVDTNLPADFFNPAKDVNYAIALELAHADRKQFISTEYTSVVADAAQAVTLELQKAGKTITADKYELEYNKKEPLYLGKDVEVVYVFGTEKKSKDEVLAMGYDFPNKLTQTIGTGVWTPAGTKTGITVTASGEGTAKYETVQITAEDVAPLIGHKYANKVTYKVGTASAVLNTGFEIVKIQKTVRFTGNTITWNYTKDAAQDAAELVTPGSGLYERDALRVKEADAKTIDNYQPIFDLGAPVYSYTLNGTPVTATNLIKIDHASDADGMLINVDALAAVWDGFKKTDARVYEVTMTYANATTEYNLIYPITFVPRPGEIKIEVAEPLKVEIEKDLKFGESLTGNVILLDAIYDVMEDGHYLDPLTVSENAYWTALGLTYPADKKIYETGKETHSIVGSNSHNVIAASGVTPYHAYLKYNSLENALNFNCQCNTGESQS